jgi:hypothetical protein
LLELTAPAWPTKKPGMTRADGGDRLLDLVDLRLRPVEVALHLPRDHHGAAILRDLIAVRGIERGLEVLRLGVSLDRADDVRDRCAERRIADRARRALHEHDLGQRARLREPFLQNLVGPVRLAAVDVFGLDLLRADLTADDDGSDDEGEPAEDGSLPVTRAPAAHAGCDVVRVLQGGHGSPSRWWSSYVPRSQRACSGEMKPPGVPGCGYLPALERLAAQEGEHREHAPVVFGRLREVAASRRCS